MSITANASASTVILTGISLHVVVNVIRGRVSWRVAANVGLALPLVYANVINEHRRREWKVLQIDFGEVKGHAKLHNDVLDAGAG